MGIGDMLGDAVDYVAGGVGLVADPADLFGMQERAKQRKHEKEMRDGSRIAIGGTAQSQSDRIAAAQQGLGQARDQVADSRQRLQQLMPGTDALRERGFSAMETGRRGYGKAAAANLAARQGIEGQISAIQRAPSAGAAQLGLGVQQNAANVAGMAAGQRGNSAAALRNAALANAGSFANANQQAAVMSAQEQQARQALEAQQRNQLAGLAAQQQGLATQYAGLGAQTTGSAIGLGSQIQSGIAGRDLQQLGMAQGQQQFVDEKMLEAELRRRGLMMDAAQASSAASRQQQAANTSFVSGILGAVI